MSNILSEKEEENIHGFTGDMKDFLRRGDFSSALILIGALKRYVLGIETKNIKDRKKGKRE